jgi:cysteine desulfurase
MDTGFIYLDNNASTVPDPLVVEAVFSSLCGRYANPSSHHRLGLEAAGTVEQARERVSGLLTCPARWITFTSGATEANNLAIRGLWEAHRLSGGARDTIVVGATEHPAVLEAAASLKPSGVRILVAPVDPHGLIDLDALRTLVDERVLLVSVMAANNETGTIAPLEDVAAIVRARGAYVHSDATQYVGRLPFDMVGLEIDLVALSGHKLHGPKGVGALAVRRGVPLAPQLHGGGHERGLRSGTLNTPGIVGLGVAAELAAGRFGEAAGIAARRDRLHEGLRARLHGVSLNGHPTRRLPNTVNLRFADADAEAVMASLPRVICSSGSACSSAVPAPSHVLVAMGLDHDAAQECLRLSLSRGTTDAEIDDAVDEIATAVGHVRQATAVGVA